MVARDAAVIIAAQALKDDPSFELMKPQEQAEEARMALLRAGLPDPSDLLVTQVLETREAVEKSPRSPIRQREHIPMGTKFVDPDPPPPILAGLRSFTPEAAAIIDQAAMAKANGHAELSAALRATAETDRMLAALMRPPTNEQMRAAAEQRQAQARTRAALAPAPAPVRVSTEFLQRISDCTGLLDPVLAGILQTPRSTVQAMRVKRTPEYLTKEQLAALLNAVRTTRAQVEQLESDMVMHLLMT